MKLGLKRFFACAIVFCAAAVFSPYGTVFASPVGVPKKGPVSLQTSEKMRNETKWIVLCMEKAHYQRQSLQDIDVREFLREYMSNLDFFKMVFLSEDVHKFQDLFAPTIDIMLHQGTLLPAYSIYDKFLERSNERLAWIQKRMETPFDLASKDDFSPDRTKADWPNSMQEADALWEKRLKFDIINQILGYDSDEEQVDMLSEAAEDKEDIAKFKKQQEELKAEEKEEAPRTYEEKLAKAKKEVLKRYERLFENYNSSDSVEIQEIFLNSLAGFYDPHTSFLSEYSLEDFDIAVRNALVGIGAQLLDKEGYCTIAELIAGGPAEESKELHPGDRILAVGQRDGEMVDAVGMKLKKVVKMIRGTADTPVRLLIEPANNPSGRKTITLIRREIQLTTKLARAEIFDVPAGEDRTVAVGVIDLPAFYGENNAEGATKGFSTTKDVEELIGKLKERGVKGLVLDLRRNGGGFLNEAVDLAGLFIKSGPVLQVRDMAGRVKYLADENPAVVWDGPLVILVSRLSASATEIVAGALQNYKRAVVVGDKATHGKGTVQTIYPLDTFDKSLKSAAKITVQKWYLPNGDSIQLRGINSDIVLPSVFDYMEVGEENKDYALKWDSIPAATIEYAGAYGFQGERGDRLISKLAEKSLLRRDNLDEFKFLSERLDWFKRKQDQKQWSLNFENRQNERKGDENFADLMRERQTDLAKSNFHNEEMLLNSAKEKAEIQKVLDEEAGEDSAKKKKAAKKGKPDAPDFDIQLREALRVVGDWIDFSEHPELLDAQSEVAANPAPNAQN